MLRQESAKMLEIPVLKRPMGGERQGAYEEREDRNATYAPLKEIRKAWASPLGSRPNFTHRKPNAGSRGDDGEEVANHRAQHPRTHDFHDANVQPEPDVLHLRRVFR